MTIHDVLAFAVSSFIGFIAGYGAGWVGKKAVHAEGDDLSPKVWWQSDRLQSVFGVILIVLALASIGFSYVATTTQRRIADCQAEQNRQTTEALAARAATSHATIAAQRALAESFRTRNGDQATRAEARRKAAEDYVAALDKADAAQQAHPYVIKPCY